jgi:hypothetical protein
LINLPKNTNILTRISRQIRKQKNRHPKGYRHKDEVIENYALIAWIIGGRRHYEILYENFKPAFPSPSSLHTKLQKYYTVLHEGQRNLAVLKNHLLDNNLPLIVSIAEDATSVVGNREYSKLLNSIVGCSLPIQSNGLPDFRMSIAKTAAQINSIFQKFERAISVMVVMAQPIAPNATPVRICSFGTDNRFTSDDVNNRLVTLRTELEATGIKVLAYSADGDTREMKIMRQSLKLGFPKGASTQNREGIISEMLVG